MKYYFIYHILPDEETRMGGYYTTEEAERLCKKLNQEAEGNGSDAKSIYVVRYEAR